MANQFNRSETTFTPITNGMCSDHPDMTWTARGIFALLLSGRPTDHAAWTVDLIAELGTESHEEVEHALLELANSGYVKVSRDAQ